ncbi:charged multivesicular body protein 7 [Periplaneta americana]|uniref:charged multivesicular body protein 7 n=1 Tax=Periplaneta americana TaxID=6978 RepID=UPI0037E76703
MEKKETSEVKMNNIHSPLKMPECWNDDLRMDYLFSYFRPPTVNPLDYESKMKFWSSVIEAWCLHYTKPMFTLATLKKAFQRNGIAPCCLPGVVFNMHKDGDLVLHSDFVQIPQQSWTAWTVDLLVKKPVVWTYNKVKETVLKTEEAADNTVYIHAGACKDIGKRLMSALKRSHTNGLLELSELAKICNMEDLDQLLVVVHGLRRQGKAAIKEEGDDVLVKLGAPSITEVDVGIYSLRQNEQILVKHLEQLETEKETAVEEARTYVQKNMKQAARSCLRKKHVLEKCMDKRFTALENIRMMLNRIQDASSDAKILEAYKMGLAALKNTLDASGLTEDTATSTMVQIEEVLDVHNEIQAAMSKPVEEDDADLEQELATLLKKPTEIEHKLKELSILDDLPEPPDSLPAARPAKQKLPVMQPAL